MCVCVCVCLPFEGCCYWWWLSDHRGSNIDSGGKDAYTITTTKKERKRQKHTSKQAIVLKDRCGRCGGGEGARCFCFFLCLLLSSFLNVINIYSSSIPSLIKRMSLPPFAKGFSKPVAYGPMKAPDGKRSQVNIDLKFR